jgi:hypothetical protein
MVLTQYFQLLPQQVVVEAVEQMLQAPIQAVQAVEVLILNQVALVLLIKVFVEVTVIQVLINLLVVAVVLERKGKTKFQEILEVMVEQV